MKLALAARTPKLALAALLIGMAPSLGTAQVQQDNPPAPSANAGACAHTEPVEMVIYKISHQSCTCSGPGLLVLDDIQIGGISVGIGPTPHQKDQDDLLVCQSFSITDAYDAYAEGGTSTVVPDHFVTTLLFESNCNTSDCGRALGFLWSTGDAKCDMTTKAGSGGHYSYKVTGQRCSEPEISRRAKKSSPQNSTPAE